MRDRRLAYHLLLVLTALLVSATASAQVTLADEASGVTLTLADSWFLVEDSGGALTAINEGTRQFQGIGEMSSRTSLLTS